MYGAIIGDIVGSKYEFHNIRSKEFPFLSTGCSYTDDSVMTVAVANALLGARAGGDFRSFLIQEMQNMGRRFPCPQGGYGSRFSQWLDTLNPEPYNSYGNGSAMRVSPCGLIAVTLEEALALAKASAEVTHNHPEGIRGAQATAASIFLSKQGKSKEEIREYIEAHFYPLQKTLDEIRPGYHFSESCQKTVPEAITAFLESESYEDAIRTAVSLGGDSDTLAAITGGIAWSFYRFNPRVKISVEKQGRIWPEWCDDLVGEWKINDLLPKDFVETIERLDEARMLREGTFARMGYCKPILQDCIPVNNFD